METLRPNKEFTFHHMTTLQEINGSRPYTRYSTMIISARTLDEAYRIFSRECGNVYVSKVTTTETIVTEVYTG